MFVGYPKGTRGGLFYSPVDKKVFVSTNATFLENDYMKNFKPRSKILLEEMQSAGNVQPIPMHINENMEEEQTTGPSQTLTVPRRSGRVSRNPKRYGMDGETNMVVNNTRDDDPFSFKKAMVSSEKDLWLEAMNKEIKSIYSNSV